MRANVLFVAIIVVVVAAFAGPGSHAQESPSILPALLMEVKGLRTAMEQMASAGPRVQLALGRLQLQEQRLNTLIMRLDTVRDRLANAQRGLAANQSQITQFETALKDAPSAERADVEHMLTMIKAQITTASVEVQRLTMEESSIAGDIASEQARWTDFNQRLEELERALGRH